MNRKGEVTSTQIVTLAIAIIGFIVVLILLWSLEFESYSDEEICRLSILSRATGGGTLGGLVPLKCTTKKICITANGKCEQFAGEKEGDIIKVKVGNGPIKDAEIIAKANADAMYDCWTMMGEGNLDLFQGGKESEQGFL